MMKRTLARTQNALRAGLEAALVSAVLGFGAPDTAQAQIEDRGIALETYSAEMLARFEAGEYQATVEIAEEALMVAAQRNGQNHPDTLVLLNNLALFYQRIGRFDDAETLYRDAYARQAQVLGREDPETLRTLHNLATLYFDLGRYEEAERLGAIALEGRLGVLGPDHPDTLSSADGQASIYHSAGRFAAAEALYLQVLSARERVFGAEHRDTLMTAHNLGQLLSDTGQFDRAREIMVRTLEARERVLGPDHPDTLATVNNLAGVYTDLGELHAAERALRRALVGFQIQFGIGHPYTLTALGNLGEVYTLMGEFEAAESVLSLALGRRRTQLGDDHPQTLISMSNLAGLYGQIGRAEEAELLYREALTRARSALGSDHPTTLTIRNNLANVYRAAGRNGEATSLYLEALEAMNATYGPSHPTSILTVYNLAGLRADAGDSGLDDLPASLLQTLSERLGTFATRFSLEEPDTQALSQPLSQPRLARRIAAAYRFLLRSGDISQTDEAFFDPAFTVAQAFVFSSAADALRASTAALTVDDPALRALVDANNDAAAELEAAEAALAILQAEPPEQQDANAITLTRARVSAAVEALDAAQTDLLDADLDLADLVVGRTADRASVQSALETNEALILFSQAAEDDALLAFVVTPDSASAIPLEITPDALIQSVARLRSGLALDQGSDYQLGVADVRDQAFDLEAAKALHDAIFAPLRQELGEARRLLVVADGPLQTLPLHVLVSSLPPETSAGFTRYRDTRWLSDEYAIARLPAVSSLLALRRDNTPPPAGSRLMLAIGDPVLRDYEHTSPAQGGAASDGVFLQFANASGAMSVADLPSLRQTAALLSEIRESLSLRAADLLLGTDAVEARISALSADGTLAQYRAVTFATHALINDEIEGLDEPAIVLTPTDENDGLLRASEVVQLNLDADLVILAACNTAAADGSPGSEALSGLAKAFFYAGSRSLLVSNWPAEASATAEIIPDLVSGVEIDGLPRSVALQRAMNRLRDQHPFEFYAHPALWAPYMVVADG